CGFVKTFSRIMFPISMPVIATVAIVQFIWAWNAFFIPLIFSLGNPAIRTLAVGAYQFTSLQFTDYTGMAAAGIIAVVPVLLVFLFFQRYFIEGLTGSLKG